MSELKRRLCNLLSVKSVVTMALTAVFARLALAGAVSQEFLTIYTMVVGFYFGTQAAKKEGTA